MKPIAAALCLILTLACNAGEITYTNPLWDGYFADPHAFKVGDTYYAVGTGKAPDGKQFPILRSRNFTDWEVVGGAMDAIEGMKEYWAPEIVERDGKFYLHYAGDRKMRVAVSDKPTGPFKDTGKWMFPDLEFSIDGHAFKDPGSGNWYLFFAKDFFDQRPGTALAVVQLADDMITPVGEQKTVMRAFADWQIYERDRDLYNRKWDAWHTVEGPAVIFHHGKYRMFYSGGNWQTPGYGVGCAVSDTVTGTYLDSQSKDKASVIHTIPGELIGPGHNSVILGPDGKTWFNVYHSWNEDRTKRQICMDPIVWENGAPVTHNPGRGKKTVVLPVAEVESAE
ncbi:MAG: glycoside hydrolase family 43 protein [Verrucomicrobiota bacterium]